MKARLRGKRAGVPSDCGAVVSRRISRLMRVLSIDPALRNTGFAILEKLRDPRRGETRIQALAHGVIKNPAKALPSSCLVAIREQLADAIDYHELSTPLSTRHFGGYEDGEIYGLEHTPQRFKTKGLRPKTPVPGLWITGQDVCTAGIAGALYGAVLCASGILGKNLMR